MAMPPVLRQMHESYLANQSSQQQQPRTNQQQNQQAGMSQADIMHWLAMLKNQRRPDVFKTPNKGRSTLASLRNQQPAQAAGQAGASMIPPYMNTQLRQLGLPEEPAPMSFQDRLGQLENRVKGFMAKPAGNIDYDALYREAQELGIL